MKTNRLRNNTAERNRTKACSLNDSNDDDDDEVKLPGRS